MFVPKGLRIVRYNTGKKQNQFKLLCVHLYPSPLNTAPSVFLTQANVHKYHISFVFVFWKKVLLCGSVQPQAPLFTQADLEPPASTSQGLGLWACATTSGSHSCLSSRTTFTDTLVHDPLRNGGLSGLTGVTSFSREFWCPFSSLQLWLLSLAPTDLPLFALFCACLLTASSVREYWNVT